MLNKLTATGSNKTAILYAFLLPALLLSTPNWSVGITLLFFIYSIINFRLWNYPDFKSLESLLIFTFLFNFLSGFPSFFHGELDGKVLDMGARQLLVVPIFLFLLGLHNKKLYNYIVIGSIVGGLAAFFIALYQYVSLYLAFPSSILPAEIYFKNIRVQGFGHSIYFGFLGVSLMFIMLTSIPKFIKNKRVLALLVTTSLLSLFTVFSTSTKGAIIAIPLLGFLLIFLYRDRLNLKIIALFISTIIIALITAYSVMGTFQARINQSATVFQDVLINGKYDELTSSSTGLRIQLLKFSYHVLKQSPLTGMSHQQRSDLVARLSNIPVDENSGEPRKYNRVHAHNEIMESAASKGIWGVIGISLLYITPLIFFFRANRSPSSSARTIARSGIIFIVGFIIFGLTETPLHWNLTSIYYPAMIILLWVSVKNCTQTYKN